MYLGYWKNVDRIVLQRLMFDFEDKLRIPTLKGYVFRMVWIEYYNDVRYILFEDRFRG